MFWRPEKLGSVSTETVHKAVCSTACSVGHSSTVNDKLVVKGTGDDANSNIGRDIWMGINFGLLSPPPPHFSC